jgi:ribosomal protein L29
VFARFIARLPLSDRELNLASLGELVELNPAQTRQVKEELAAILTCDEAKLAV